MSFIEDCQEVLGIDSTPQRGSAEVALLLGAMAEKQGLLVEYQSETIDGLEQKNVIVRLPKKNSGEDLLLQTHLDTIEPGRSSAWSKTGQDPFNASIDGDRLYGLGASNVKLDFLCKLKALSQFVDHNPEGLNPVLVGTYGEESGMAGAVKLIRHKIVNAKYALVGEPTHLQIGYEGPGTGVVEVAIPFGPEEIEYRKRHDLTEVSSTKSKIFSGKAAHAGHAHLGDSAIEKMFKFIDQLPNGIVTMEINGGVAFNIVPDTAYLEFDVVGSLNPENVVSKLKSFRALLEICRGEFYHFPDSDLESNISSLIIGRVQTFNDHILLTGGCRILSCVPRKKYEKWIENLEHSCEEIGASFRLLDFKRPFVTDTSSLLVTECEKILRQIGLPSELTKLMTNTEASVFGRLGIECVCLGAGDKNGGSLPCDEFVSISELKKSVLFYEKAIERFCK